MLWLVSVSRHLGSTEMTPMVRSLLIVHTPQGNRGTEYSECLVNPDVEQTVSIGDTDWGVGGYSNCL